MLMITELHKIKTTVATKTNFRRENYTASQKNVNNFTFEYLGQNSTVVIFI